MAVSGKTTSFEIPFYEQDDEPPNMGTVTQKMAERLDTLFALIVPSGSVVATARSTAPTGYLLCDGSAVSRTTYKLLFEAIGTSYGTGNGTTTFNLPDLRERVPVGKGASMALASAGGEKTHVLSGTEMPSHSHTVSYAAEPGHIQGGAESQYIFNAGSPQFSTNASGGGAAHNNMQPYQVVNYLVKT